MQRKREKKSEGKNTINNFIFLLLGNPEAANHISADHAGHSDAKWQILWSILVLTRQAEYCNQLSLQEELGKQKIIA